MQLIKDMSFPVYSGPPKQQAWETECPYSVEVITAYLKDCHDKYVPEEKSIEFKNFREAELLHFRERRFWILQCDDDFGRTWDIVIGQGKDPTFGATGSSTWMTGDVYVERHTAKEIVINEYPEHKFETGKTHS